MSVSNERVALPSLGRRNGVGAPFPNPGAKQGEPGIRVLVAAELEHLGFHAVGALQAPGGHRDAAREHDLQRPDGRQLRDDGRLERRELGAVLLRQQHVFCARMPCFSAFCAERALPSAVLGPRDFAPFCGWPRHAHCSRERPRAARRHHSTWRIPWLEWAGSGEGRESARAGARKRQPSRS